MSMRETLEEIMNNRLNTAFCSEADFQFTLAWKIKEDSKGRVVILEYPEQKKDRIIYYDIYVREQSGEAHLIELKYRTKKLKDDITRHGNGFKLKNQGAQPIGRYLFFKDISRLEHQHIANLCSYCIMLTNDPSYYNQNDNAESGIDKEFKIGNGNKIKKGEHSWAEGTSPSITSKFPDLKDKKNLEHDYDVVWKKYPCGYEGFKYLLLEIPPAGDNQQEDNSK